jgi:hypothetical protein
MGNSFGWRITAALMSVLGPSRRVQTILDQPGQHFWKKCVSEGLSAGTTTQSSHSLLQEKTMATRWNIRWVQGIALCLAVLVLPDSPAQNPGKKPAGKEADTMVEAGKAKPLSQAVVSGAAFLVRQQQRDGGWSEGIEAEHFNRQYVSTSTVAHTSLVTLALLRMGHAPGKEKYGKNVEQGILFVCGQVEKADKDSLWVSTLQKLAAAPGTANFGPLGAPGYAVYIHMKLGRHIDTVLALHLLAEAKGRMPDDKGNERVAAALEKVLAKITRNQRDDGTWLTEGLAPQLTHGLAIRGLIRARQAGATVDNAIVDKAVKAAVDIPARATGFDISVFAGLGGFNVNNVAALEEALKKAKDAKVPHKPTIAYLEKELEKAKEAAKLLPKGGEQPKGELGKGAPAVVEMGRGLYGDAALMGALLDSLNTVQKQIIPLQMVLNGPAGETERGIAKEKLQGLEKQEKEIKDKIAEALKKAPLQMHAQQAGFGGGEEYLSLMLLNEVLLSRGSKDWDKSVGTALERQQNRDGSWVGKHCLTGKNFCTAAVLLMLTADRSPAVQDARQRESTSSMSEASKSPSGK